MSKIFLDAEGNEHLVNPKDDNDVNALNALGLNEKKDTAKPAAKKPAVKTNNEQ